MRAVFCEVGKVLCGRWLFLSAVCTAAFLWLGLGSHSYWMISVDEYSVDFIFLLNLSLTGESTMLSLPLLAALPAAASALTELRTGAFRAKVFRTGKGKWQAGKVCSCAAAAVCSQIAGIIIFSAVIALFTSIKGGVFPSISVMLGVLPVICARALSAVIFAGFGMVAAVLSGSSASAYVAPLAACFSLKLIGSRFFPGAVYINPAKWLCGDSQALILLTACCAAVILWQAVVLGTELKRHG